MKLILFFYIALLSVSLSAQKVTVKQVQKTPFKIERFVGVDKFDNLYGIKKNTFYKYEGQKEYHFSDIQLGHLTSVDILNPLKIVLFYRDMNTVVIVDNRLNEIKRINFNTIQTFRTVAFASAANDQNIWIFNLDLQQLEVFNYNRNTLLSETPPISDEIKQQVSNFNFCWLLSEKNLLCYNSYGSLIYEFPTNGIEKITEDNDNLIALKDNKLSLFMKKKQSFMNIPTSEIAVKDFYLNNENLYLYDGNFVYQYQLDLPN